MSELNHLIDCKCCFSFTALATLSVWVPLFIFFSLFFYLWVSVNIVSFTLYPLTSFDIHHNKSHAVLWSSESCWFFFFPPLYYTTSDPLCLERMCLENRKLFPYGNSCWRRCFSSSIRKSSKNLHRDILSVCKADLLLLVLWFLFCSGDWTPEDQSKVKREFSNQCAAV